MLYILQVLSTRHWRDQLFRDRYETETFSSFYTRSRLRPRLLLALIRDRFRDWDSRISRDSRLRPRLYYIRILYQWRHLRYMTLYETETETETAKMHYTSPRPRLRPLSLVRLETRRESRLCLVWMSRMTSTNHKTPVCLCLLVIGSWIFKTTLPTY